MDELTLLADLHKAGLRQGPGSPDVTRRAMVLAGLDGSRPLEMADIGCGTGGASLELARMLDARITAVDFLPSFLDVLRQRAQAQGLGERIMTLEASMDALPFTDASFDVIWSEGAVYNMGFEAGIATWKRFLKPGGKLVLSEITWTTAARPQTITDYWTAQYPEIDTASAKLAVLERHGYRPEGYFLLPPAAGRSIITALCGNASPPSLTVTGIAPKLRPSWQPRKKRWPCTKNMASSTATACMWPPKSKMRS